MKISLTKLLGVTTSVFMILSLLLGAKLIESRKEIKDREYIISTCVKVIEAIGRTNDVNIQHLKTELAIDFKVENSPFECCDDGLLYHTIITSSEENIRSVYGGKYMGGAEIITDSSNNFKSIMMYKP